MESRQAEEEGGFSFPVPPDPVDNPGSPRAFKLPPPLTAKSTVRPPGGASMPLGERAAQERSGNAPATSGRQKVPYEKGYSPMDWMRLSRSGQDLSGTGGARVGPVTMAELAKHRSPDDAWIAVRGRVYNLTSYLPYHPGGAKILMAHAGKDATMAFNRYHAWVNVDALLGRAFVGVLEVEEAGVEGKGEGMVEGGAG